MRVTAFGPAGSTTPKSPSSRPTTLWASRSSLITVQSMKVHCERSTITLGARIDALASETLSDSYRLRSCSPTSGTIATEGDAVQVSAVISITELLFLTRLEELRRGGSAGQTDRPSRDISERRAVSSAPPCFNRWRYPPCATGRWPCAARDGVAGNQTPDSYGQH